MKRLTNVSADGLYILKLFKDGETDFDKVLRRAIEESARHKRMTEWSRKSGVSETTMSQYHRKPDYGISMYTARKLLEAQGLRLTVEVDT